MSVIGEDITFAVSSLQLCAGQPSGGEAAVHPMREAFQNDDTEGILLIDATNAFNSLNRAVALYNIRCLCPSFSTILMNTYRSPACLYVDLTRRKRQLKVTLLQCHSTLLPQYL